MSEDSLGIREWNRMLQVNLLGGIEILQIFQDMIKENKGNIVMIFSIVAKEVFGKSYTYAASKKYPLELWNKTIAINLTAPFFFRSW